MWCLPDGPQDERPHEGFPGALSQTKYTHGGHNVNQGNVDSHGPVDVSFLVVMAHELGDVAEHLSRKIHDESVVACAVLAVENKN